ncbi:type II toxin-antitoxin system Phd/YefM family antitoxin [soil metagenome]
MKTISAAEANRQFSKLLRDVKAGESVTITSHGEPVAQIIPVDAARNKRAKARKELLAWLDQQPVSGTPRDWTRDELYDDDP